MIDYRLNILGVRVWEHSCQLVAKAGEEWRIRPRWDLPMHVSKDAEEVKTAAAEPPRLPVYQYCAECPGSDLAEVLSERKDFTAALENAVLPLVATVKEAFAPR